MEFQQLKHFLAVAQSGSIRTAAEHLGITQSGISRSIKKLEDAYETQLFNRTSTGVSLTEAGQNLLPKAKLIMAQVGLAEGELVLGGRRLKANLNIGVTSNYAHYLFSNLLSEMDKRLKNATYVVYSAPFDQMIRLLRNGTVDLVLGLLVPGLFERDLIVEELFQSRSGVYARADNPLTRKRNVTADQLVQEQWGLINSEGLWREVEKYFNREKLDPPIPKLTTNSFAILKQSVIKLNLVTVLPVAFAEREVKQKQIRVLRSDVPGDNTKTGLIYRKEDGQLENLTAVVDILKTNAKHFAGGMA